ncbi:ubiquinol oxidase 1b, mitochondrial-like [Hordeum vulgare subsp. vulgare]|uniref:Ubiquinol oxidase n=2 Tax=Hordeum vulgare TaxID=4513 RepID=A0A8I7B3T4_HORVV|nr:ubiquinol oxidase 1b, mitochondrial-like [Hordeum vulgare subsp. vulgare]QDQ70969.1 mitochondrial alternating oxidase 1d2 [Hordeum vulgare]
MSSRMAGATLLRHLGPRLFVAAEPASGLAAGARGIMPAAARIFPARMASTEAAAPHAKQEDDAKSPQAAATPAQQNKKAVVSYWGIEPRKLVKDDGTEWPWFCFRPWDTYRPDTSIDVAKHHEPRALPDKVAYFVVRSLRVPRDLFFQRRHASHALLLETVAAVPPMVGGVLLHLRSLRRFEHSGGWIRALMEEAENERMHLMTFMEVTQPRWWERALVLAAQGVFFNAYFVGYLISPKFAHRFVGYLEEEAVESYTEYLKDLEAGLIENTPAPAIAIDYWRLPADARLKDVVTAVRADEAHHRDANHYASDIHYQGMTLNQTPAPLGYH